MAERRKDQPAGRTVSLHLLAAANAVAALGGGQILTMGSGPKGLAWSAGSLLAFLIGPPLGLLLYLRISARLTAGAGTLMSVAVAACSLGLWLLLPSLPGPAAGNGGAADVVSMVFFALLCLHFGFWFIARSIRADVAAETGQRLSAIELSYYFGLIAGLILGGVVGIGLSTALVLNSLLQLAAGGLDWMAVGWSPGVPVDDEAAKASSAVAESPAVPQSGAVAWSFAHLAAVAVAVTVGTQIVIFSYRITFIGPIGAWMLATFYGGAAMAAIFFGWYAVRLEPASPSAEGPPARPLLTGGLFIRLGRRIRDQEGRLTPVYADHKRSIPLAMVNWLGAATLAAAILGRRGGAGTLIVLTLIALSTAGLEITLLAVLVGIRSTGRRDAVVLTFCMMAAVGAVTLAALVFVAKAGDAALLSTLVVSYLIAHALTVSPLKKVPDGPGPQIDVLTGGS